MSVISVEKKKKEYLNKMKNIIRRITTYTAQSSFVPCVTKKIGVPQEILNKCQIRLEYLKATYVCLQFDTKSKHQCKLWALSKVSVYRCQPC